MSIEQPYQKEFEARLEKLDAQIVQMRAQADQANADVKIKYHEQLRDLSTQKEALTQRVEAFKSSSEAAWENVTDGFEAAYTELQTAFEKAVAQFRQ